MTPKIVQQAAREPSKDLVSLLLVVANNELLTHQIYSYLKQHSLAEKVPELIGLFEAASTEDWDHYHEILKCVERLKGLSSADKKKLREPRQLRQHMNRTQDLLRTLRQAEESLINAYTEICTMTLENDFRTFDLSYRNLHENLHHQHLVTNILSTEFTQDKNEKFDLQGKVNR